MVQSSDILTGRQRQYILREKLGEGGEGTVYTADDGTLVAKIYKQPTPLTERKILCMLKQAVNMRSPGGIPLITWPQDILYQNGRFVGYIMPCASGGKAIWNLARTDGPYRSQVFGGHYDWSMALVVAANLASIVAYLHERKIVIGDMNSNNIMVHPNGFVTIMDVDSFDLWDRDTGEHFKCRVGRPEYLPPELQGRNLAEESAAFTEQSDDFALAVHIFQLLFSAHPFNMKVLDRPEGSRGENQQADGIVQGRCPYVHPEQEKDIQPGVPYLTMLPEYLQKDFRETFSYHALDSIQRKNMRTKAALWQQDLGRLYQERDKELVRCAVNPEHYYLRDRGCELCRAAERRKKMDQEMIRWNIRATGVNTSPSDMYSNMGYIPWNAGCYFHYEVKNSPLSMNMPLSIRQTFPNGESTGIQPMSRKYRTGDTISINGTLSKPGRQKAGPYTVELLDGEGNVIVRSCVSVVPPAGGTAFSGSQAAGPRPVSQGPPGQKPQSQASKVFGVILFCVILFVGGGFVFSSLISSDSSYDSQAAAGTQAAQEQTTKWQDTDRAEESQEAQTQPEAEAPLSPAGSLGDLDSMKLRLANEAGEDILALYVFDSNDERWGRDWFGEEILSTGYNFTISLETVQKSGTWDMGIELYDRSWQFHGLDPEILSAGSEIWLYYDEEETLIASVISNDTSLNRIVTGEMIVAREEETEVETEAETAPPSGSSSEYVLPDSDSRYYSEAEVSGLDDWSLRIAINEIYARHGRMFSDSRLQEYFNGCSWYTGTISGSDFDSMQDSILNSYEKANVKTFAKVRDGRN